ALVLVIVQILNTSPAGQEPEDDNIHPTQRDLIRLNRVLPAGRPRGIFRFTHLAREGRMTVTIGRRELLAALGGAAVAWPFALNLAVKRVPAGRIAQRV